MRLFSLLIQERNNRDMEISQLRNEIEYESISTVNILRAKYYVAYLS